MGAIKITTFSGGTELYIREITLDEFYDGDIQEIDDYEFICSKHIDMVVIERDDGITYKNFYVNGRPVRFETYINGVLTDEENV